MRIGSCIPGNFQLPGSPAENEHPTVRALVDGSRHLRELGYDFIEATVESIANLSDAEMEKAVQYRKAGLLCLESCNCFIPGALPLIGEKRDPEKIRGYLEKVLPRLVRLGVEVVVFGSGGARWVPEGCSPETAREHLDQFLRTAEELARKAGVTLVVEPLNHQQANCIFTVTEAAGIVRRLNLPSLKLLGDTYHMYAEGEPPEVLFENRDILRHVHVAEPESRSAPTDCPYLRQIGSALRRAGYTGRVAMECTGDFRENVRNAAPVLRKLF